MNVLRFIPELPLLRRELIELSNRRRTYVLRFLGAIIILTLVVLAFYHQMAMIASGKLLGMPGMPSRGWNPNKYLGSGGRVFFVIVPMLFHSVHLLMPGLTCGAITLEKERNTLGTLFVTRLSPMTIVLEKLGSRLVPMVTFLLLTFPLLAFVYSLGGVDKVLLLSTLWLLLCECVVYASIGLLCSSWFATTASSFICAYVLTGLLVFSTTMLHLGRLVPVLTPYSVWSTGFRVDNFAFGYNFYSGWFADQFSEILEYVSQIRGRDSLLMVGLYMAASVPSMLVAAFLLLLARIFLIRRAFISSSSMLLRFFKLVDRFFTQLNDNVAGGVVLVRDHNSLPLFDPVAWRERAKKSLGKARYLFRILVAMEGPVLFICVLAAFNSDTMNFTGMRSLLYLIWGIVAMILAMKASTIISSERARETLDALLSTPLTAREIVQQKIAGMRRLMIVLSIPILSVHLTLLLLHFDPQSFFLTPSIAKVSTVVMYGLLTTATTFMLMHLISWISALAGLRSKSQTRSVMAAIMVLGAWLVASMWITQAPDYPPDSILAHVTLPYGSIETNEGILRSVYSATRYPTARYDSYPGSEVDSFAMAMIVFVFHVTLTFLVRMLTLRMAPRLLGRRDTSLSLPTEGKKYVSPIVVEPAL